MIDTVVNDGEGKKMYEPETPMSGMSIAAHGLKSRYLEKKDEYLELCWQYNLPPRDMSLLLMGRREIEPQDRIRLIRLIIQLMDMEKLLTREVIQDYLFAENESEYANSAIFSANIH